MVFSDVDVDFGVVFPVVCVGRSRVGLNWVDPNLLGDDGDDRVIGFRGRVGSFVAVAASSVNEPERDEEEENNDCGSDANAENDP